MKKTFAHMNVHDVEYYIFLKELMNISERMDSVTFRITQLYDD